MTAPQRVVVRSGKGRLHVAHELEGVGYLAVCGSLVLRPLAIEALDAAGAARVQAARPGAVCHYCRLIGAEAAAAVERALEVELDEQQLEVERARLEAERAARDAELEELGNAEAEAAFIRRYGPGVL